MRRTLDANWMGRRLVASWRALIMVVLVSLTPSLPGCGSAPRTSVRVPEPRVDVVIGQPLVLTINEVSWVAPRRDPDVRLDDGRRLPSTVRWIRREVDPGSAPSRWTRAAERWTSTEDDQGDDRWVILVEPPIDAIGQGIWVQGRRCDANWLRDPSTIVSPGFWVSPLDAETLHDPMFRRLAAPTASDPTRRWRFLLAADGLVPRTGLAITPGSPYVDGAGDPWNVPLAFDDPIIDAFSDQIATRWRVALASLGATDPNLASDLRRRLVATVRFPGVGVVPAWSTPGEDALLSVLTDSNEPAGSRASFARTWLASLPSFTGTVLDDAGVRTGLDGDPGARVLIASLIEPRSLAWVRERRSPATPEPVPIEPWHAVSVVLTPASAAAWADLTLHLSSWQIERRVQGGPMAARPPGVRLGPLLADWTMASWIAGREDIEAAPMHPSTGLLSRRLDGRWELVLQMQGAPERDRVRVHLGPTGHERAIYDISRTEAVNRFTGEAVPVEIETTADGWLARVLLPETMSSGEILIGLERDAAGAHSAWPRRMFPWSDAPGRWRLDLDSWDTIDQPG